MKNIYIKTLSLIIVCCLAVCCLTACNAPHAGDFDDDDWNSIDWGSIISSAYDDTEYIEDVIYDICLFDADISDIKTVDVAFVEQKDVATYFDEDKIYEKFALNLDVNKLLTKFAVGTGVIVICLVFTVATAGASTPVVCIATGALNGAITGATSGAILGGIIGAISGYLSSDGDFADTLSGAIEGIVDGYMWGAVSGAISGAVTSDYCFVAGTPVKTPSGYTPIEAIQVGDEVWSYNHETNKPEIKRVANVFVNSTSELATVYTGSSVIEATPSHEFYINNEYRQIGQAQSGDSLLSLQNDGVFIDNVQQQALNGAVEVYNFEVEGNHNYFVGDDEILVHNKCINEKYADQTYHFDELRKRAESQNDASLLKRYQDLMEKYPNGVPFVKTETGVFAVFDGYVYTLDGIRLEYTFPPPTPENYKAGTCLRGDNNFDFELFKQRMRKDGFTAEQIKALTGTGSKFTIHHRYDTQTLQLVPSDIHGAVGHTGGASLLRQIIKAILS